MDDWTQKFVKELNSGTTSLALLALLVKSGQPMYGYEIGIQLANLTEDGMPMNQGALYPVLRSLERQGLLASKIEPSDSGPPRRYYSPTTNGRKALKKWKDVWQRTKGWLDQVLEQENGTERFYSPSNY